MAGDGTFVDVGEKNFIVSSTYSEITDQIQYTRDYADKFILDLGQAITDLSDVVGTYNPVIGDIDTSIDPISSPSFPLKPTFGELVMDDSFPDNFPTNPSHEEYGDMDFEYVSPLPPDEISANFDYSEDDYTSEMWDALFTKINYDIINGGTGLTDAVHASIVAREQESRRVSQDEGYRSTMDSLGARGFNIPTGQMVSAQVTFNAEILKRDQDSLNTITGKDFDLAQSNSQFAVSTGKELESLLRSTFDSVNNRGLDAVKASKDFLIRTYEANIKAYLAKWDGVKLELQALQTKVEAITSKNDGLTKTFLGQADGYKAQIEGITAKNAGLVAVRTSEVDIYTAEIDSVAKEYTLLVEEYKANVDAVKTEVHAVIEEEKINLSAYTSKAEMSERISTSIANITAQTVASSLGAINTGLSKGFSGQETNTEIWKHSDSLGETHSFKEK